MREKGGDYIRKRICKDCGLPLGARHKGDSGYCHHCCPRHFKKAKETKQ